MQIRAVNISVSLKTLVSVNRVSENIFRPALMNQYVDSVW